ncbi:MAG: CsbD family protein [Actinocatenispora sp.]
MSASDKAENKKDELVGGAKKKLGEATDDPQREAEGEVQKDKGHLGQAAEKVKDTLRD